MTRLNALTSLRDQCKAELHWNFSQFDPAQAELPDTWIDAFNGSLDAAKALHEAVLPGYGPVIDVVAGEVILYEDVGDDEWEHRHEARSNSPARAWLLAILEALIAQEKEKT